MDTDAVITIHVNGAEATVATSTTVADLVASRGLRSEQVAVELNREIVPRATHASCAVGPGDRVEIVTLVGGG